MKGGKKFIQRQLHDCVASVGFLTTKMTGMYLYDFNDAVKGWLGIGISVHQQGRLYSINPNVGVYYPELERLFYTLNGMSPPKHPTATVAHNIGYLGQAQTFMGYYLESEDQLEDTLRAIVSDIQTYGLPWMRSLLDRDALAAAIRRYNDAQYSAYRLPIYGYLESRPELIEDLTAQYLAQLSHYQDFVERYERFCAQLRQLIAGDTSTPS